MLFTRCYSGGNYTFCVHVLLVGGGSMQLLFGAGVVRVVGSDGDDRVYDGPARLCDVLCVALGARCRSAAHTFAALEDRVTRLTIGVLPWELSATSKHVPSVKIYTDDERFSLVLRQLQPVYGDVSREFMFCTHKADSGQGVASRLARHYNQARSPLPPPPVPCLVVSRLPNSSA